MAKANIGFIGLIGEETKEDFWGAMRKAAEIGYRGVEGARELLKGDVKSNLSRFHELGLQVITYSAKRAELRENLDTIIANAIALEAPHVSVWGGPSHPKESLLRDAELYNEVGRRLAAEGLKLCYHNHEREFITTFNGLYALDILAEFTDPQCLYFELDVAWATFGGADPVQLLHRMAGRVPAIHIKDLYALSERGQFTAVGTGVVKVKESVTAAIETGVDWVVVEQDRVRNLTPFETLTASYLNLKEAGLV
ncbi:MAG: sugar phosphate isomerase/epimerase [Paenibacillaceae bacterium]|jgi:sugar phosphate isomerase/epimerase|nr:sugar phosphate isomerase/epimerase [Paenibacillaceae bacterium]